MTHVIIFLLYNVARQYLEDVIILDSDQLIYNPEILHADFYSLQDITVFGLRDIPMNG